MNRRSRKWAAFAAGLFAALAAIPAIWLVRDHTKFDSASYDEPVHIMAGYFQVFRRSALPNVEHPPLIKEFVGLALRCLSPPPSDVPLLSKVGWFGNSGHRFLFENRVAADRILAAARAPILLFFAALCGLCFEAARRRYGIAGGVTALFLVAYSPNFLAHAGIVDNDLAIAFFWLAVVLQWACVVQRPSGVRVGALGLLLGLAIATKFTGLFLIPTLLLAAAADRGRRWWRARSPAARSRQAKRLGRDWLIVGVAGLVAIPVVLGAYEVCVTGMDRKDQARMIRFYLRESGGSLLASAAESPPGGSRAIAQFLGGVAAVRQQSQKGYSVGFLNGRTSNKGFPLYYIEAFTLKSTPAMLAAAVLLALGTARRRFRPCDLLFAVPVVYYFLLASGSSFNLGVRHLLPVYPIVAVWAGRLPGDLQSATGGRRGRVVGWAAAALFCGANVLSAVSAHPHELSYFNFLGGGQAGGFRYLADSNVDWGLDLRRLASEIRRRGVRAPTVVYFGGDSVVDRIGVANFADDPVVRGRFVAFSATLWDIGPYFYRFYGDGRAAAALEALRARILRKGRLVGRIGGSTFLFELAPNDSANSPSKTGILPPR